MNKMHQYGRRQMNVNHYPPNYPNSTGYTHSFKKGHFQNRQKSNHFPLNNIYYEDRRKNKYYFDITTNNSSYQTFQNKNNNYNQYYPYFTEETKNGDDLKVNSIYGEFRDIEPKEGEQNEIELNDDKQRKGEQKDNVIMKIRINISKSESKFIIFCKGDNLNEKVEKFCNDNNINEKLVKPLLSKVEQSLRNLKLINNYRNMNKNDILILNEIKEHLNNKNLG